MSRENLLYICEAIASLEPSDIEGDTVEIAVETDIGDTSFEISIVETMDKVVQYLKDMH